MKKNLLTLIKFALPVAIIAWLMWQVHHHDPQTFNELLARPKNWPLLCAALLTVITAVSITFIRWYLLVRTLEMKFSLADAFRLGFLGYLFNFVSAGSVGGDLFKAIFIAREQPTRKAEAVATVLVDRMIGLYALLVVTSVALLITRPDTPTPQLTVITRVTFLGTVVGGVGILMVLMPGFTSGSVSEMLGQIPKIGPLFTRLIRAVRMYRSRPGVLAVIGVLSLGVHCLNAVAVYMIATALFSQVPPLSEHMIVVPLGMVAGAIPGLPAGLGAFEFAIKYLYETIPTVPLEHGEGLVVALGYRIITIVIAMIGVAYYWASRREVSQVLHEAEEQEEGVDANYHHQPLPVAGHAENA